MSKPLNIEPLKRSGCQRHSGHPAIALPIPKPARTKKTTAPRVEMAHGQKRVSENRVYTSGWGPQDS